MVGALMTELIVRLRQGGNSIVLVFTMITAYFSFIVAEHSFHSTTYTTEFKLAE